MMVGGRNVGKAILALDVAAENGHGPDALEHLSAAQLLQVIRDLIEGRRQFGQIRCPKCDWNIYPLERVVDGYHVGCAP